MNDSDTVFDLTNCSSQFRGRWGTQHTFRPLDGWIVRDGYFSVARCLTLSASADVRNIGQGSIMGDFFHGWRRKTGCVTLVMACVCGCAKSLSTNLSTHSVRQNEAQSTNKQGGRSNSLTSEANTGHYSVEIMKGDGNQFRLTGSKIEYRLNDAMLSVSDGKLCIDGKVLTTLNESDIVVVEDSRTIAVNGVLVWPVASE